MIYLRNIDQIRTSLSRGEIKKAFKLINEVQITEEIDNNEFSFLILKGKVLLILGFFTHLKDVIRLLECHEDNNKPKNNMEVTILKIELLILLAEYEKAIKLIKLGEKNLHLINEESDLFKSLLLYHRATITYLIGDIIEATEIIKETIAIQKKLNDSYDLARSIELLGYLNWNSGDLNEALRNFKTSFSLGVKRHNKRIIANNFKGMAYVFIEKGELDTAIEYLFSAADLIENVVGERRSLISIFLYLTDIYKNKLELNKALFYGQKCFDLTTQLGNDHLSGEIMYYLGMIMEARGETDSAIKFYNKSISYHNNVGRPGGKALSRIATIHHLKKEYDLALTYYKKCLSYFNEIGYDLFEYRMVIFQLIKLNIETGKNDDNDKYIEHLHTLSNKDLQKTTLTMYNLVKALRLKSSKRLKDIAKSQEIYMKMANEEIIHFELTVEAIMNMCDILLYELKASGLISIVNDLQKWIHKLENIAKKQFSYSLQIEVLILKSKLSLLSMNFDKAKASLAKAKILAKNKLLKNFSDKIAEEENKLFKQVDLIEKIVKETGTPPLDEIVVISQFKSVLGNMLSERFYPQQESDTILAYADKVRTFFT